MTPGELKAYLGRLVRQGVDLSVMIWGPPGIGKSSIVAQVADGAGLELVDVRLSQLAPTDLRGLPVAKDGKAVWYPPEFLPREGRGVLFLDEFNMAAPAVQGIAQQLILDRAVGSYRVPEGWFIWAAGNRKEDRAAVFEMPAPLANRFLHLTVLPDFLSFRVYAIERSLPEAILAFLSYRVNLLHKHDPHEQAWPSPRTWEMAGRLYTAGLAIDPAVGEASAMEFQAFSRIYDTLTDLEAILEGRGERLSFPREPSARYAVTVGLGVRARTIDEALTVFRWMSGHASTEWVQLLVSHLVVAMRARGQMGLLAQCFQKEPDLQRFLEEYQALLVE